MKEHPHISPHVDERERLRFGFFVERLAISDEHDRRPIRQIENLLQNFPPALSREPLAARGTMRDPQLGKEDAQIIIHFRHRADGGARTARHALLIDGNGRTQVVNGIHIRFVKAVEEIARVRRKRLDIAPIGFRKKSIEGQRRFSRARKSRHHHERIAWNINIHVLQIIDSCAANFNHRFFFWHRERLQFLRYVRKKIWSFSRILSFSRAGKCQDRNPFPRRARWKVMAKRWASLLARRISFLKCFVSASGPIRRCG